MKASERTLYNTFWTLIILASAITFFWPRSTRELADIPNLTLNKELATWFSDGRITHASVSQFHIQLSVRDDYRLSLRGEAQKIAIGYQFLRGNTILFDRHISCRIDPSRYTSELILENPKRVHPNNVVIYLAH